MARNDRAPEGPGRMAADTSARAPLPLPFQLLLVAVGLGLLPVFAPVPKAGRPGGPLIGLAFFAWFGVLSYGLARVVLAVLPILSDPVPSEALAALARSLAPGEQLFVLYLAASLLLFLMSLGSLHVDNALARGSSLFSALFSLVAALSAIMSAITSFLGVRLVFQSEDASLFTDWVLPFFLSVFVFVFALALWVGGGNAVHTRHWTPAGSGAVSVALGFLERLTKWVLLAIPAMALFVLSTWTSALGLGGKETVKLHYELEVARLVTECERAVQYTSNEEAFLRNLRQNVDSLKALAQAEQTGALSGVAGAGPAATYLTQLTAWLDGVANAAQRQLGGRPGTDRQPEMRKYCQSEQRYFLGRLKDLASSNLTRWERLVASRFESFRTQIMVWRERPTAMDFVATQLASRELAVPPPNIAATNERVRATLEGYTAQVETRLLDLVAEFGTDPPRPLPATPVWTLASALPFEQIEPPAVDPGDIPGLQFISARQAILQYAFLAIDIWAFAIAWDFASYALIIIYIFFPGLGRWNEGASASS